MIINIYSREFKTRHIQMYETCSEGTPISPVFKTPEELAEWLFENQASQIIKGKIQLDLHIERRGFLLGLFFCCSNGDYMSCTINPFTAIFNAFENSQVGNMKYQRSKTSIIGLSDD